MPYIPGGLSRGESLSEPDMLPPAGPSIALEKGHYIIFMGSSARFFPVHSRPPHDGPDPRFVGAQMESLILL